jgi:cellulose synthase/poly-beta-1,6-N-acetylglucosamine synthase-like glycosyltransferase
MKLIFWISVALLVHTFLLYPLVLLFLASMSQLWRDLRFGLNRKDRRDRSERQPPFVSLVFAAHNEAPVIWEKMRNCQLLDYPKDRLEILVGCDGCQDETASLIRGMALPNVRVFEFGERCGKPGTLNKLVPLAVGEILVFSDANTMFLPGSIQSIVRHFSTGKVGCVCGELKLVAANGGSAPEGMYWRYESFLKFLESRLNMLVGANGGIFAIRSALYAPLPPGTITDDFLISMSVRARGWRAMYDPEAVGCEETASLSQEFRRRVRIGAGNLHALRYTWRLLAPTAGLVSFSYWSHKVCRWLVPFTLLNALLSAILLADEMLYALCAAAGLSLAGMGLVGYYCELRKIHNRLFSLPYYFLAMNLALLLGFVSYLFGRQRGIWKPTARGPQGPPIPAKDTRPQTAGV